MVKADTAKVFYQGPELNAPLGICVLSNKVIVSQSPFVWVFYDDNGDDKADRKEIMFEGIGGEQHDHGMHAFTFGPDGKLYFNCGNEGKTLKDKNGKTVLDQDGDEIGPKKYKQGMVFRCDTDGSHVECLGQNFRNPYEVAVDSYSLLWQSDNDDDGNKGVRINYVMDYGNYGYTDEMTGASWQSGRTNMEDSIPLRHWHLNDPGAVPNLLQTGAGSPTGMVIYEGSLMPKPFQNQMIHCDAGPNVVRSYPVENDGAGYKASVVNILKGEKDQWFRPADICVAPDGSLIVADWYDVGVGGHQAGDQTRGRIYRIAPTGSNYTVPKQDYTTASGLVTALQSPNLSVRQHAFTAIQTMGDKAVPELQKLWTSGDNPRMRARAFWALIKMKNANTADLLQQAAKESDPHLRMLAIRAAREINNAAITSVVTMLVNDKDIQVRREAAIALHHNNLPGSAALFTTLATQYDGKDRWYLEALGIAADRQWDPFFKAYLAAVKDPLQTTAGQDIVWRARTELAVPYLAQLASDKNVVLAKRLRYFRAFDFNNGPAKQGYLVKMIEGNTNHDTAFNKLVLHHMDLSAVAQSKAAQQALKKVLQSVSGTNDYLELVQRFALKSENPVLLQMALHKENDLARDAVSLLLAQGGAPLVWQVINEKDTAQVFPLLSGIGGTGTNESIGILQTVALSNKYPDVIRQHAAHNIGHSGSGEDRVLVLLKNKQIPAALIPDLVASVSGAWRGEVRKQAQSYLPKADQEAANKVPQIKDLLALKADVAAGKTVFTNTCSVCHMVNTDGKDFGPKLSEIGSKYPPEGLLEAIVHPSAGISFGYEGWDVKMKDGSTLTGIISSKTETDIDLKYPGGTVQHLKTSDVASKKELKASMMPEGLYAGLSTQDMANLISYLSALKKK